MTAANAPVSSFGEIGLMQLKPVTAKWICNKFNMPWKGAKSLYDPVTNIKIGAVYLAQGKIDDAINIIKKGLKKDGMVIVNSSKTAAEIKKEYGIAGKVVTVNATRIATEVIGRPIANTTMLGALIKATGAIKIEALKATFAHRFGKLGEKNYASCQTAFNETTMEGC
jgi:2-oxoacid:acceptor oxidoreductase gamma subunit (pyruvate/2-ketoisovalerate family)